MANKCTRKISCTLSSHYFFSFSWLTQILLSELGFDEGFMNILRKDYLMPIAKLLYPEWVGLRGLASHRAFIVKYTIAEDVELSYHYDNAEVTLNVCLGKQFKGGELYFGPMRMVRTLKFYSM